MTPSRFTSQNFNTLYTTKRADFVTLANSYVEDRAVAEDIVTDCFVACWLRLQEIPSELEQCKYIGGAIKKKCLEHLRNRQNHLRIQQHIFDENYRMLQYQIVSLEHCNPEKILTEEMLEIYRKTLDAMPRQMRDIFLASRQEDLSYREIAEKFQVSQRKVADQIQQALALLRLALKDYLPAFILIMLFSR